MCELWNERYLLEITCVSTAALSLSAKQTLVHFLWKLKLRKSHILRSYMSNSEPCLWLSHVCANTIHTLLVHGRVQCALNRTAYAVITVRVTLMPGKHTTV